MPNNEIHMEQIVQDLCELKAQQACLLNQVAEVGKGEHLTHIEETLSQTKSRLSRLEAHKNRGLRGEGLCAGEDLEMKQSFEHFVRKGGAEGSFEIKELSTDKTDGLVSHYISDRVLSHMTQVSSLRSMASLMQIDSDSAEILVEESTAEAGWVGEKEARIETGTPHFTKVTIQTHELYAKPMITQKLLDDARLDLESWIVRKITDKMVAMENHAFLLGDGHKKPKGLLHYGYGPKPNKKQFQSIAMKGEALKTGDLVEGFTDTLYALKPGYLQGAVWMMSRHMISRVRKLRDEKSGHFLWQPSLAVDHPSTLLGYPIVVVDDMPALDEKGSGILALFGNLKHAYQVVDRSSFSILRDPYSSKPNVEFYVTRRVGGDVINFEALKVLNIP